MHEGSKDQAETLRFFTMLAALRNGWAGRLILSCGLGRAGSSLALAANIAGATCLSIDRSPEACRAALRQGAVDFVVNSLDEALRALKNEIRKGHPLSVALEGDPESVLAEIREQGLLPELFTGFVHDTSGSTEASSEQLALQQMAFYLRQIGTISVNFDGTLTKVPDAVNGWDRLRDFTAEHGTTMESFTFDSLAALRSFDARVLDVITSSDSRRRWAAAASSHFQRSRPPQADTFQRCLYVTDRERVLLAS